MTKYILNGPKDWEEFEQRFGLKITAERVAHLVELANPADFPTVRLTKPERPTHSNYLAKVPSGQTRFVRGEQPASTPSELLPEDHEALKAEWQSFRYDETAYKEENDGIRNVINWLNDKVAPHYVKTCGPEKTGLAASENIAEFYFNLKQACGTDDFVQYERARKRYFEVLKESSNPKGDWEAWIATWEQVMQTAKRATVAEALHSMSWFSDLVRHLKMQFQVFMSVEQSQQRTAITNGTYSPAMFAAHFRQEAINTLLATERPHARVVGKGSFGPTFQASNRPNQKRTESPNPYSREQGGKRAKTDGSSEAQGQEDTCILCDRMHPRPNTSSCWIAFPENKPPRIKIFDNQTEAWERRLKENKEVRDLYSRLKSQESRGEGSSN